MKTSNSSSDPSKSETSTITPSPLIKGWDEVASSSTKRCKGGATFGMLSNMGSVVSVPSGIGSVVSVPSGIGPAVRKPGAVTLIRCRRGSLALITHLGAWKLLEMGM